MESSNAFTQRAASGRELVHQGAIADALRDLRGAPVPVGEVERVADRVRDAAQQEVLAVRAAQVGVHVHERPLPVDPGQAELAEVGEERLRERAALPREPVAAARHPVPDREVALLLADREECRAELHRPVGHQRRDERQLGPVDVPHGAQMSNDERAVRRPERALLRREARLDERVVQGRREHGLAFCGCRVDRDRLRAACATPSWCGPGAGGIGRARRRSRVRRFSRACSTPRSEKPMRTSMLWPGSLGAGPHQAERPQGRRTDVLERRAGCRRA